MVGFRKGALGSPFSTEYQADEGMDTGSAERGDSGPRVGPGYLGRKVTMEVSKSTKSANNKRGGGDD